MEQLWDYLAEDLELIANPHYANTSSKHFLVQRNRLIEKMFNSQIRAMSLIMGLFILSAIIQSITSLFVLLSERTYDLSVLTMLGMSSFQRYSMFAAYGLLLTFSNTYVVTPLHLSCASQLSILEPALRCIRKCP